ncbi:hypothetical protein [Argonema galeatum]|uniref:hypothetical protein n=1 Tax=Argonema galeatum TaxID=2942762 RepID=UPI002012C775|nr:hypothetical protein [Argonema galeatum]MCL1467478.1 hypothetical protein [Argonema galeatum A003/A1]
MNVTIKPMLRAILAVLFAVVLAGGLQVGTVNAKEMKPPQPTSPTQQPTIMPTSPTIMPTSPTMMPTVSPEFYEQLQKEAKEANKAK